MSDATAFNETMRARGSCRCRSSWDQQPAIRNAGKSLPSGVLQDEPGVLTLNFLAHKADGRTLVSSVTPHLRTAIGR